MILKNNTKIKLLNIYLQNISETISLNKAINHFAQI